MAALDRALALDKRQHRAVLIAEQLDFDVRGRHQPPLEVDRRVAERGAGFRPRGAHRAGEVARVADRPHALAAAARHRLDQQRVADARGEPRDLGVRDVGTERRRRCRARPARRRASPAPRAAVLLPISAIASASDR